MLANYLSNFSLFQIGISLLDILLVWFLVYTALKLLIGTRGLQLVKGIFIIVLLKITFNLNKIFYFNIFKIDHFT